VHRAGGACGACGTGIGKDSMVEASGYAVVISVDAGVAGAWARGSGEAAGTAATAGSMAGTMAGTMDAAIGGRATAARSRGGDTVPGEEAVPTVISDMLSLMLVMALLCDRREACAL